MPKCCVCGREIRYITDRMGNMYICDPSPVEVITDSGMIVAAYERHICHKEGMEDGKKKKRR